MNNFMKNLQASSTTTDEVKPAAFDTKSQSHSS